MTNAFQCTVTLFVMWPVAHGMTTTWFTVNTGHLSVVTSASKVANVGSVETPPPPFGNNKNDSNAGNDATSF